MKRAILLLALLLAGCAEKPSGGPTPSQGALPPAADAPTPIDVPPLLRGCALAPAAPPAPRTVEQVGAYARDLADAYADCAYRLKRLNDLIEAGR